MADAKLNLRCTNCNGLDFYLQDGLYFCEECHIQYANLVEMEYDEHNQNFQSQSRIRLAKDKAKKENLLKSRRLTSFEEYNFILIGLVDEILNIEVIPDFKATVLQLWISFLRKIEAAFFDKEKASAPKMFAISRQADAEILYNKKPKGKQPKYRSKVKSDNEAFETGRSRRKRMRKSEKIISQELSDSMNSESCNSSVLANMSIDDIISEHENAELDIEFSAVASSLKSKQKPKPDGEATPLTEQTYYKSLTRKELPLLLCGTTLLNIIYCALNICGSKIQLSDLVRFVREGHLSFYKCKLFLPEEIIEQDIPLSHQQLHKYHTISYESLRAELTYFVRLIPDLSLSIRTPNLIELSHRYVDDLQLPSDLKPCIERLMTLLPSKMKFYEAANTRSSIFPNFEGRAIAFVLFVLKLLFGIDGYREEEMSNASRFINQTLKKTFPDEKPIFVYKDWMLFLEYRDVILQNCYHPAALFHRTYENDKPYLAFNSLLRNCNPMPKNMEAQNVTRRNVPRMQSKLNAQELLGKLYSNHSKDEPMSQFTFQSSFTPLKDNLQHIVTSCDDTEIDRKIVDIDYSTHSVEAFLRPKTFVKKLKDVGKKVKLIKSTFPKSFVIEKAENWYNPLPPKEDFDLVINGLSAENYALDLKKRQKLHKSAKEDEEKEFHDKQFQKILEKRKKWRSLINEDKANRKEKQTKKSSNDETQTTSETRILSDSSDGEETGQDDEIAFDDVLEPELAELFHAHSLTQSEKKLTFVAPDFNLWNREIIVEEPNLGRKDAQLEKLPKNFVWLLNHASNILGQHPLLIYHQLLCIEHQFLNVYQPVELMDNVLLQQDRKTAKKSFKMENSW